MAALTPKVMGSRVGMSLADGDMSAATATTGDTFPAGPNSYLAVKNASGGDITVTIKAVSKAGPLQTTLADLALTPVVEATTGLRVFGPFPAYPFADASGNVTAVCSAVTTVKVAAITVAG